ncbi:hypothetical protein N8I77_010160 [Diaporthe amygdali]|uniref:Uncharacterized protein n=1 Tax=Phomopsis amygdali TaxID=1214568 RepID=A0AAD9VZ00_PHOAM|nr:hypothetical protein N8I77_010160 [Diaporthe amygdali]
MGEELYVATSAVDVTAIYKETERLDFDPIIRALLTEYGLASGTLDKLFDPDLNGKRSWMSGQHDIFRSQMHPGSDHGDLLESLFLGGIDQSLNWDHLSGPMVLSEDGDHSKSISLWKWCGFVSVQAATRAFFGEGFLRVVPDFVEKYIQLEDDYWHTKSGSKLSQSAAKIAFQKAQQHSWDAFKTWLSLPQKERQDASWMVRKIEQDFEKLGIDDKTQLSALFFAHSVVVDMAHLLDTEKCPLLNSLYDEVLRTTNDPMGIRVVTKEVTIGGRVLKPGRKLLMPYKQMHYNAEVFGSNVAEFDPHRFTGEKGALSKSNWFRPFGGANGHCPGRFLARREVYLFTALFLFRFEVKTVGLEGKQPKFPVMDTTTQTGGILRPFPREDVKLEVRPAKV